MGVRFANERLIVSYDERIEDGDTAAAWLVRIEHHRVWFPKSICELYEQGKEITAPRWLVEEKGLESYADSE